MAVVHTVTSSNLEKIGYDFDRCELLVIFKSEKPYVYQGVPRAIWDALMEAKSKGRYFIENIRKEYPCDPLTVTCNEAEAWWRDRPGSGAPMEMASLMNLIAAIRPGVRVMDMLV